MEIDLNKNCRICLGDDENLNYLYGEFDQGTSLKEILSNTTGFTIEESDGLSVYICQNCTNVIVEFYNLKAIFKENEKQIRALLTRVESSSSAISANETCSENLETMETLDSLNIKAESNEDDVITIQIEPSGSGDERDVDSPKEINSNVTSEYLKIISEPSEDTESSDGNKEDTDDGTFKFQEIRTFTCPECGDCFLFKKDIHTHMVSKHDIDHINYDEISELSLLKVENNEEVTKCKICNEHFTTNEAYKAHLETHKKNVCDICGMGFVKKSYLKDHQEIHCNEKRHVCTYCNKAFKRRTVLVKHKRIHTHPRQCVCEICGKAFNDKGTLKTHIMLLHLKERNYVCLICGVKFPLKGTLEKHIRRHQNKEREFFCTECPLGYRDKSSLDRHIHVKHSGQNVKVTCGDCGKQYTSVGNLSKHQKICHNECKEEDYL